MTAIKRIKYWLSYISFQMSYDTNTTVLPFRMKCAVKFKIICDKLVGQVQPLPACVLGEWGPSKVYCSLESGGLARYIVF